MDGYEIYFAVGFILFWVILIALIPKPIERITNSRGKILIEVYQNKLGHFRVHDKITRRKLSFRTFVDTESYIMRRLNRWPMHSSLNE